MITAVVATKMKILVMRKRNLLSQCSFIDKDNVMLQMTHGQN